MRTPSKSALTWYGCLETLKSRRRVRDATSTTATRPARREAASHQYGSAVRAELEIYRPIRDADLAEPGACARVVEFERIRIVQGHDRHRSIERKDDVQGLIALDPVGERKEVRRPAGRRSLRRRGGSRGRVRENVHGP